MSDDTTTATAPSSTATASDDESNRHTTINWADVNNVYDDSAEVERPAHRKRTHRTQHKSKEPKEKRERVEKPKKKRKTDAVSLGFIDEEVEVSSDESVSEDEKDD